MTLLAAAACAWALAATAFTLATLLAIERMHARIEARSAPARWPRLWVLRPCDGDEPGLGRNLASSLAAYPGERRAVALVPSEDDPACAVARQVAADDPALEVLVTGVAGAPNRKSAQLAAGLGHVLAAERPDDAGVVVVQADSDVCLDGASLPALARALGDDPRTAAAFAAPVELHARTPGDFAASGLLSASHQDLFALAALSQLSGGTTALGGALAAHRLPALVETGGFRSLERLLGEDFEVGRRLHARGLAVAVGSEPARCTDGGRTLGQVVRRTARWATVVRRQRPGLIATYPLLLGATPLLLVLGHALALSGYILPLGLACGVLALRAILAAELRRLHGAPVGPLRALGLALAAETLMLAATALALARPEVEWRGRRLRVGRGGVIE
jgi:ceramide glucosyltransferase